MKKFSLLLAMLMLASLMLTACGQSASSSAASESQPAESTFESASAEPEEEDEENYKTGDAALDNPRNQDEIGEKELLVVSFGTSFNDSRRLTIGAIESALEKAFPEYAVRRGFTSQIIIDHVAKRDGEIIDNMQEALDPGCAAHPSDERPGVRGDEQGHRPVFRCLRADFHRPASADQR